MGFDTPELVLKDLVADAALGKIQLPDFQRSYRWDDERVRDLLVTVLRGHPMGVLMLLATGNEHVHFQPRPLERVDADARQDRRELGGPDDLLLDGQQRMTSLYQALSGSGVVRIRGKRKSNAERRYFVDVELALGGPEDTDSAVQSLPADGVERENFDRDVKRDLSTIERQTAAGIMPFTALFDGSATTWMIKYMSAGAPGEQARRAEIFERFNEEVITPVQSYRIPAIRLDKSTTREAVATVFNKVNQGGLHLDNFELLTAIFAGDRSHFDRTGKDFRLRDDWDETRSVIAQHRVLTDLKETDFLQVVLLLASLERHRTDIAAGKERPRRVTGRGDDVLDLALDEYLRWAPQVREALSWTARFYTAVHIHDREFVPYRTQIVPLTAFRVLLGDDADKHTIRDRLKRWYWCGVLGELYGSTTETRFARDIEQVPDWARAASTGQDVPTPRTVMDARFSTSRLWSLQTRNSAAYKGIYALMLAQAPRDWRQDLLLDHASYFDLQVDIHHIFPKKHCEDTGLDKARWNSVVNKTPLAKKTNIWLSGRSPATYTARLEKDQQLPAEKLDEILRTHLVDPTSLRAADFDAFFAARQQALVSVIEQAMGKPVFDDLAAGDEPPASADLDDEPDDPEDPDADWSGLHDVATRSEREVLTQLAELGVPRPELGAEASDGIPVPISWPYRKIAVGFELSPDATADLSADGWRILPIGAQLRSALS